MTSSSSASLMYSLLDDDDEEDGGFNLPEPVLTSQPSYQPSFSSSSGVTPPTHTAASSTTSVSGATVSTSAGAVSGSRGGGRGGGNTDMSSLMMESSEPLLVPKKEPGTYSQGCDHHCTPNSRPSSACSSKSQQQESSEYSYAQALLKHAPKLASSGGDLDRASVLRLAQAYITLQQGLKSFGADGDSQSRWCMPGLDAGKLALAAQETMGCFVLILTSKGQVVFVSEAVEKLLGHDQLQLVGRSIQSLVHPEELSVMATQFSFMSGANKISSHRSFYTRMLNARKSKASHQMYELVHVMGHLQEVALTAKSQGLSTDSSAGDKETWLMCACKVMRIQPEPEGESTPTTQWISHHALDGKIIYMDARSSQVSGYLPHEVNGMSPYCFIHQDDLEHVAFSHNQALINVGGSSCTYRMFTRIQNIVYVHTEMQLARDKVTNRPKFLFSLHQIVNEKEGREQISRHQQELMWVKTDPSMKYSMNDIERTVKCLEMEMGSCPKVLSKGGMQVSVLTDSCSADGGDLLALGLTACLRKSISTGLPNTEPISPATASGPSSVGSNKAMSQHNTPPAGQYGSGYGNTSGHYRHGHPHQQHTYGSNSVGLGNSYSPGQGHATANTGGYGSMPMGAQTGRRMMHHQQMDMMAQQKLHQQTSMGDGDGFHGGMYPGAHSLSHPHHHQQQQHNHQSDQRMQPMHQQSMHSHNNQQQQQMQGYHSSAMTGQMGDHSGVDMMSPQSVMGQSASTPISADLLDESSNISGSFVDYLFDNAGPPSVPSSIDSPGLVQPPTSGRGSRSRGRARGRPRGSGRGTRGINRGSRGPRARGRGRGRGRGASAMDQIALLQDPSLVVRPARGRGSRGPRRSSSEVYMGPAGTRRMDMQHAATVGHHQVPTRGRPPRNMELQRMSSEGSASMNPTGSHHQHHHHLQRMHSQDSMMYQRMGSIDSLDMLDGSDLSSVPNIDLLSPQPSWTEPTEQISPVNQVSPAAGHMRNMGQISPANQQSPVAGRMPNMSQISPGSQYGQADGRCRTGPWSMRGKGSLNHSNTSPVRAEYPGSLERENFQRSMSFQESHHQQHHHHHHQSQHHHQQQPHQSQHQHHQSIDLDGNSEFSILGNLLKGRSGSTSSLGSKSPGTASQHTGGANGGLPLERAMSHNAGMDRPVGKSPVPSVISEPVSPVSIFSPDPIKEDPVTSISPLTELAMSGNSSFAQQQQQRMVGLSQNSLSDGVDSICQPPADLKTQSEKRMFSAQLLKQHRSLGQSLVSQDRLLRQLENNLQQASQDPNAEANYARLNAQLEFIKASKARQEKELAELESQVRQQQQRQHQQQQQQQPPPPPPPPQAVDVQRHRLNSPILTNHRRMAIVPPIQRQSQDGDQRTPSSQTSPADPKANSTNPCAIPSKMADIGKSESSASPSLTDNRPSPGVVKKHKSSASMSGMSPKSSPHHPQVSPYSLHHHHHHHHHYHHHPMDTAQSKLVQNSAAAAAAAVDFNSTVTKGTANPGNLPFSSTDTPSTFQSSAGCTLTPNTQGLTLTSMVSPIVCDTSPVSIDESCASDTSSGYHSLSIGSDTTKQSKPFMLSDLHMSPQHGGARPGLGHQLVDKSPDITSNAHTNSISPHT